MKNFSPAAERHLLGTFRLEALGDAVFAIVMTLLVLELRVPEIAHSLASDELLPAVAELWPNMVSFFISFIILGLFWAGHNLQFHYITKSNRTLFWINIFFYFFISLIPFSAALLGRYFDQQLPVVFYGLNLTIAAIFLYLNWMYATRNGFVLPISPELKREAEKYMLFAPLVYILAVLLSFLNTAASLAIYLVTPVFYFVPSKLDRLIYQNKGKEGPLK